MAKNLTTQGVEGIDYEFITGIFNQGLNVLSTESFRNDNYDLILGNEFCISLWINNSFDIFFTKSDLTNGIDYQIQLAANVSNNNNQSDINLFSNYSRYVYNSYSSYYSINDFSSNDFVGQDITDGNFHHVLIQRKYDGLSATTEFYLDNMQVLSETSNSKVMVGETAIADRLILTTGLDVGAIDNLRIYHRSISAEEVELLATEEGLTN